MLLKNKDIVLRAVEPEDLEILYRWENSTVCGIMAILWPRILSWC
jgi:hypothetical protein